MKVLFAVNNESISESIIKLYQKEYREIISGKNVYYFNAIIKELQRDQTYDRIIISEDLEPYTNNNFDIIDKFLFEQLDKISDEAISVGGEDIPIIFIASDRRSKSDNLLSKLFSIGIYNALLGTDRTMPEVCRLVNKPRTKKEAKVYYKIETDEVSYHAESEDSVSETEIQNIITHYKRLGKNTDRYVESFNNIAAQYNDAQLRIISKFLPIGVKAILEAESPKYQSIMTFGEGTYKKAQAKEEKKNDLKIGFIETNSDKGRPTKPVVIPSVVKKDEVKKLTRKQEKVEVPQIEEQTSIDELEQKIEKEPEEDAFSDLLNEVIEETKKEEKVEEKIEKPTKKDNIEPVEEVKPAEEVKPKKRGRPKKQLTPEELAEAAKPKKRGRPRKQPEVVQEETKPKVLPGTEEIEENTLPGFDELEENTLPGFEEKSLDTDKNDNLYKALEEKVEEEQTENYIEKTNFKETIELTRLLSREKKVVAFVGTSKCGTSFLINNVADLISKSGISTAILDVTNNRNSYYIYTRNEEPLRRKAIDCLESLEQDIVDGIEVSKNLTVFTSIPGKKVEVQNVENVIAALVKKYSLVLIDCDYQTPFEYFEIAQEIYLIQNMDILTIQPLTAFLRDLQSANKLSPLKLKVIINQAMKVRGLSVSAIIGGMSCYNDPEMSYMRNLFDKERIPTMAISYDREVAAKYLSGMVDCIVTTNGYSKQFMSELKKLADMVYPLINSKSKIDYKKNKSEEKDNAEEPQKSFSRSMSSTLDKMKKQFK